MTAHPWLRDQQRQVPLDMFIYRLVKAYLRATPFKRAALKVFDIFYMYYHLLIFFVILCIN